jgi:hypothetical protein
MSQEGLPCPVLGCPSHFCRKFDLNQHTLIKHRVALTDKEVDGKCGIREATMDELAKADAANRRKKQGSSRAGTLAVTPSREEHTFVSDSSLLRSINAVCVAVVEKSESYNVKGNVHGRTLPVEASSGKIDEAFVSEHPKNVAHTRKEELPKFGTVVVGSPSPRPSKAAPHSTTVEANAKTSKANRSLNTVADALERIDREFEEKKKRHAAKINTIKHATKSSAEADKRKSAEQRRVEAIRSSSTQIIPGEIAALSQTEEELWTEIRQEGDSKRCKLTVVNESGFQQYPSEAPSTIHKDEQQGPPLTGNTECHREGVVLQGFEHVNSQNGLVRKSASETAIVRPSLAPLGDRLISTERSTAPFRNLTKLSIKEYKTLPTHSQSTSVQTTVSGSAPIYRPMTDADNLKLIDFLKVANTSWKVTELVTEWLPRFQGVDPEELARQIRLIVTAWQSYKPLNDAVSWKDRQGQDGGKMSTYLSDCLHHWSGQGKYQ